MKRKATLVALACAVVGAGCLHIYLTRYELEIAGGAPSAVLVATRDLALGEVLTRAALDFRELPERYIEERHIVAVDLERVLGTRVTGVVGAGAALLWTDLDVSQEGRTLSGLVQTGMRAFALPERDVSFDGLLRPGDRADVLFTRPGADTVTLLQNLLVLTVGTDLGAEIDPSTRRVGQAGRVTLSVSIEQAQRLAQCEGRGALRLALRNPQDLVRTDLPVSEPESELGKPRASVLASRPGVAP
jgi:pilus assembly protein CpaB